MIKSRNDTYINETLLFSNNTKNDEKKIIQENIS